MKSQLTGSSKTYTQDADTCSCGQIQEMSIHQLDGGGGPFWRINTEEWAIDSIEELVELLEEAGVQHRKAE